jgi:HK97 family phage prohead protease
MPDRKTKALIGLKIENADEGTFSAVFAKFDVIDHDGDVTVPGAFTDGEEVRISAYNHQSWKGALPVGKGIIRQTDTEAIVEGKFFLDTAAGRDTFEVAKQMGDLQEWSYGYDTLEEEPGTKDGRAVNFLKRQKVHEVSPVILGAGIETRTLALKEKEAKQFQSDLLRRLRDGGRERWADDDTWVYVDDVELDEEWAVFCISPDDGANRLVRVDYTRDGDDVTLAEEEQEVELTTDYTPKAKKLSDHLTSVLTDVMEVTDRLAEVKTLRENEGKALGKESADAADSLTGELEALTKTLREVLTSADDQEAETKSEEDEGIGPDVEAGLAEATARVSL